MRIEPDGRLRQAPVLIVDRQLQETQGATDLELEDPLVLVKSQGQLLLPVIPLDRLVVERSFAILQQQDPFP